MIRIGHSTHDNPCAIHASHSLYVLKHLNTGRITWQYIECIDRSPVSSYVVSVDQHLTVILNPDLTHPSQSEASTCALFVRALVLVISFCRTRSRLPSEVHVSVIFLFVIHAKKKKKSIEMNVVAGFLSFQHALAHY